jgi:hypothetical protein
MRQSTVAEFLQFLAANNITGDVAGGYHIWGTRGDIHVAPALARENVQTFSGMQQDTEEMHRQMHSIAVSDFDCPV